MATRPPLAIDHLEDLEETANTDSDVIEARSLIQSTCELNSRITSKGMFSVSTEVSARNVTVKLEYINFNV